MSDYYNDLAADKNNMSFWLPKIQGKRQFETFNVPKTAIVPVPEEIMELFFMEKQGMTQTEMMLKIMEWVRDEFVPKAEAEIGGGIWFVKNGGFSNKFDFRNCKNVSSNLLRLTANIIDINYASFMFDTGGNTELVARQYIYADSDSIPCIYEGMPLRNETRIFYDFDSHKVLYGVNYWDWDYCHDGICRNKSDKIVYEDYYPTLEKMYQERKEDMLNIARFGLADVAGLSGIWSVDFMEQFPGGPVWLIDMALGHQSAYWNPALVTKDCEQEDK